MRWVEKYNDLLDAVRRRIVFPTDLDHVIDELRDWTIDAFEGDVDTKARKERAMRNWFRHNVNIGKFLNDFKNNYLLTFTEQDRQTLVLDAKTSITELAKLRDAVKDGSFDLCSKFPEQASDVVALMAVIRWGVKSEGSKTPSEGYSFEDRENVDQNTFVKQAMACLFSVFDLNNQKLVKFTNELIAGLEEIGEPFAQLRFEYIMYAEDPQDNSDFTKSFSTHNLINNLAFLLINNDEDSFLFMSNCNPVPNIRSSILEIQVNIRRMVDLVHVYKTRFETWIQRSLPDSFKSFTDEDSMNYAIEMESELSFKAFWNTVRWGVSNENDVRNLNKIRVLIYRVLNTSAHGILSHFFKSPGIDFSSSNILKSLEEWFEAQIVWCLIIVHEREKQLSFSDRLYISELLQHDINHEKARDIERTFYKLLWTLSSASYSVDNKSLVKALLSVSKDNELSKSVQRERLLRLIAIHYTSSSLSSDDFECPRTAHQRACIEMLLTSHPVLFQKVQINCLKNVVIYDTGKKYIALQGGYKMGSLNRFGILFFDKNEFSDQAIQLMGSTLSGDSAYSYSLETSLSTKQEDKEVLKSIEKMFGRGLIDDDQQTDSNTPDQMRTHLKTSASSKTRDVLEGLITNLDLSLYDSSVVYCKIDDILSTFKETDESLGFNGKTQEEFLKHLNQLVDQGADFIDSILCTRKRKREKVTASQNLTTTCSICMKSCVSAICALKGHSYCTDCERKFSTALRSRNCIKCNSSLERIATCSIEEVKKKKKKKLEL